MRIRTRSNARFILKVKDIEFDNHGAILVRDGKGATRSCCDASAISRGTSIERQLR